MRELPFRSIVLPLLPPLVPTGALVAAQLLGAATPLVLSTTAAAVVAWIAVALWALRRAERTPTQAQTRPNA